MFERTKKKSFALVLDNTADFCLFVIRISLKNETRKQEMYKQSISSDEAACQAHLFAKNTSPTSLWRKKFAREAKPFTVRDGSQCE